MAFASTSSSRAIIPYERICDEMGEEEWKKSLPAGMKFRPTKEDLIVHYLQVKILGGKIYPGIITDNIDIYQYHPKDLLDLGCKHDDGKMYFFTPICKKVKKGDKKHINRSVKGEGSWKATNKRANVESVEVPATIVGTATQLTFCTNANDKSHKTSWLMTELRLPEHQTANQVREMTLCVVYQHVTKNKTPQSSSNNVEG